MKEVVIRVGDIFSTVETAPTSVFTHLRDICRARPEGYMFMPKYQSKVWDGYITLMKGMRTFPTGLLSYVSDALRDKGFVVNPRYISGPLEIDITKVPEDICYPTILRDYQVDAVEKLLSAGRGVARMATNAGKTVVFAALIKLLGNADAVVVVHSKDLLYQTRDRLEQYLDRPVGIVGDGYRDDDDIVVATVQTLHSIRSGGIDLGNTFSDNKIIITDETHHIGHNTVYEDLLHIPGWHRYGFSGTPLNRGTLNDLKLIASTGPLAVDVNNAQLIEEEWSATPKILFHDVFRREDATDDDWEMNYFDAYALQVVESYTRNNQVCDIAISEVANGSVLIIVTQLKHGEILYRLLKEEVDAIYVNGSSSMRSRSSVLRKLGRGDNIVCIATPIFDEGVDVPSLDSLILACAGKSHIKLLQRVGRGLRKKEGENVVHIHDFIDSRNKYLLRHTEERLNVYKREGFEIILVEEEAVNDKT